MRPAFFRRGRGTFFHPSPGVNDVMGVATREADAAGTDSLDILVATLATPKAVRVVKDLGGDPRAIQIAAPTARISRDPRPGLTNDAKAVVEAVGHRAILARANPDIQDVLVALAAADCLARQVLRGCEPSTRSRRSRTEGQLDGSAR
jgi:hypothetical protein